MVIRIASLNYFFPKESLDRIFFFHPGAGFLVASRAPA
jgi:hypothetical protein